MNRVNFLYRLWTGRNCAQQGDLPVNTANSQSTVGELHLSRLGIYHLLNMSIIALPLALRRFPNIEAGGLSRIGDCATRTCPLIFRPPRRSLSQNTKARLVTRSME